MVSRGIAVSSSSALIGRCFPQFGYSCPQRTTLGLRDVPLRALQDIRARRVGKVAKVVYACRGAKMMDSMRGMLGLHAFAIRAFDRQQIPRRETPPHRVRQRGAEASGV
jgi:hypothetical protein